MPDLTPFASQVLAAITAAGWLNVGEAVDRVFRSPPAPKEPPRDHRARAVGSALEELFTAGYVAKCVRPDGPAFGALPLGRLPPRAGLVEHGWVRVRGRHLPDDTQIHLEEPAPVALLRIDALLLCLATSEVMTVVGGFDGRDKLVVVKRRTGYLAHVDGQDRIISWPPEATPRGFESLDWLHVVAEAKV